MAQRRRRHRPMERSEAPPKGGSGKVGSRGTSPVRRRLGSARGRVAALDEIVDPRNAGNPRSARVFFVAGQDLDLRPLGYESDGRSGSVAPGSADRDRRRWEAFSDRCRGRRPRRACSRRRRPPPGHGHATRCQREGRHHRVAVGDGGRAHRKRFFWPGPARRQTADAPSPPWGLVLSSGESDGGWIGPVDCIIKALVLSPFVSHPRVG